MEMNWTGVYPALTTKFYPGGGIDLGSCLRGVDAQVEAGVSGLILSGTLGEASVLSTDEKRSLTREVVRHLNGRLPVVVNIAEGATDEAVRRAAEARDDGASGLMILPPMRYTGDHRELVAFFKEVASATSLPVMIYNNPVDYKTLVTPEVFDELLQLDQVQAVKESTRDVSNVTRLIGRYGDRLKVLCGVDTLALESFLLGAHGWVAGLVCAFPRESVALFNLARAGRLAEAVALYRWFMPLLELDIHPKLVQYIKLAEQMTGLGTEHVRKPRLPLEGEERERIQAIIRKGLETRPSLA
jgi:4-hydroxy-tetrahydrodipicolinate synthase